MAAVTGEWSQLHTRFYRKTEVYEMLWTVPELDRSVVVGAPYGGPIAMVRDERFGGGGENFMRIFTSAGKPISHFTWKHKGLAALGWSDKDNLVCVLDDGTVFVYTVHGERLSSFSMGVNCKNQGIADVHFWPTGMVVRTGPPRMELWYILSFDEPRPVQLPPAGLSKPPTAMTVIAPQFNVTGTPEVLLATAGGSIIVVDSKEAVDQEVDFGPFVKMTVSPSGGTIACFNEAGNLHLLSTDFQKNLSKFMTGSKVAPKNIVWCGEEATVLYWDKMLLMVNPFGDFVKYTYDGALILVTECDGVRIVTERKCEFLHKVPESTLAIFKTGTHTPAALLYDATDAFESKSVKADENIRSIKDRDHLTKAIDACLDAAAHEFNHKLQRQLLKAASYGKLCADQYKADHFVDQCRILRVLNAVRHVEIGIPLTFEQYTKLEAEVLVSRLINRHNHLLALRVCKHLRLPPERVLVHWACAKIKAAEDEKDEELGNLIVNKLSACPGITFAQIATTAHHAGRRRLATQLLEYEPLALDQVQLLLSMKEDALALDKAIDSGDADLVYLAMLHIHKNSRSFEDFFLLIRDKPLARSLYITYAKQQDLPNLKKFWFLMQRPVEAANVAVLEGYLCADFKERLTCLEIAHDLYDKDKSDPFPAKSTEEQIKLLRLEQQCEIETGESGFVDTSVSEVIERFITTGRIPNAMKLKTTFAVPEKRLYHIEVRTLAKCKAWGELAKLATPKKVPPIGFLPFVEACVEHKELVEAAKYIARLPDAQEQMEWLCTIGYWQEAAVLALKEKDYENLEVIRARCRTPTVITFIDRALAQAPK